MAFVGSSQFLGSVLGGGVVRRACAVGGRQMVTMAALKLYVKAGENGEELGDCPFSHKAILMMSAKNVEYDLEMINLTNKPDWYLELNKNGTVPTLVDGDEVVDDSDGILKYVEEKFPEPPLLVDDPTASEATAPVFGAFAGFVKNKDPEKEEELKATFETALDGLDAHLKKNGPYVAGEAMSTLDFNLAPKLWHAKHALAHYKEYEFPEKFDSVNNYMDTIFSSDVFKKTLYPPETVVWGWSKFFK
uniref:glutathione dehydrogenase (ascorbate) n=2 Tax=Rhodosorus marinus TaxID=101924 RepID=A0A7S3AAZ4_9RHOD|mmetsp:Transcript_847/g.2135  ORF Transcript_847/g.2135 Transcript_847/m.2135 type:complete len:247 (+) Transcript_847:559-1299(+)|eukprot:CAMPEP_0113954570 /NCGR_PEP_ID=MMETSP0011_2-20120614/653_1 /TAXON_ID=101924 /ORGANISM="Rhodosorus marinus" /LENGTH=246 /DNA_ID=CAMNT_0000963767 /DNA_START=349 /DNA_END=1089 /DNA_ORIENTATION=+ /assembly_acc=CAM_ASM_000156